MSRQTDPEMAPSDAGSGQPSLLAALTGRSCNVTFDDVSRPQPRLMVKMQLTDKDLAEIVGAIRAVREPAAIVLFGSQARGDAGEHSDLDLLVVRHREFRGDESRRRELGRLYRAVADKFAIPKDILLFTPHELEEWRHTTNHAASEAVREGRVLYGQI